jgi:hypothetical protein
MAAGSAGLKKAPRTALRSSATRRSLKVSAMHNANEEL